MQTPKTPSRRQYASLDVLKRSAKACNRCRKRRTKCLGDPPYPCMACADAGHACVYSESEKRVNVPESYLIDLQTKARKAGASGDGQDIDCTSSEGDAFGQDIELGFSGTDNWVLSGSGQYRMSNHPGKEVVTCDSTAS